MWPCHEDVFPVERSPLPTLQAPNSLGLIHLTEDGAVHEMCLEECLETLTSSGLLSLRSVDPVSFPSVLLMLQKSCVHQLRLVVYPIIYKVFYIPGGCLGFLNHQRCMSPKGWGYSSVWYGLGWSPGKGHQQDHDTVDGRNPAPVDMEIFPFFTGFHTCWVVQEFFHQQHF